MTTEEKPKRGFALLSKERLVEIAKKGGSRVAPENRAFAVNRQLASRAGQKGGARGKGKK